MPADPPDAAAGGIVVYGTQWCGDCKRAKQFFGEQRVHYSFVDVDVDAEGLRYVEEVNGGKRIIPVILFADGSTLVEPSNAELAAKLELDDNGQIVLRPDRDRKRACPVSLPPSMPPERASTPWSSSVAASEGKRR